MYSFIGFLYRSLVWGSFVGLFHGVLLWISARRRRMSVLSWYVLICRWNLCRLAKFLKSQLATQFAGNSDCRDRFWECLHVDVQMRPFLQGSSYRAFENVVQVGGDFICRPPPTFSKVDILKRALQKGPIKGPYIKMPFICRQSVTFSKALDFLKSRLLAFCMEGRIAL